MRTPVMLLLLLCTVTLAASLETRALHSDEVVTEKPEDPVEVTDTDDDDDDASVSDDDLDQEIYDLYYVAVAIIELGKERAGTAFDKANEIQRKIADAIKRGKDWSRHRPRHRGSHHRDRHHDNHRDRHWGKRSNRDWMIIERIPDKRSTPDDDVAAVELPFNVEVLKSLVAKVRDNYERARDNIDAMLEDDKSDINKAYRFVSDIVAQGKDKVGESYEKALVLKQKLADLMSNGYERAKERVGDKLDKQIKALNDAYDSLEEALKNGGSKLISTLLSVKSWIWESVDDLLNPFVIKKKRQIDFEFNFGIERFFNDEFNKSLNFLSNIFHRGTKVSSKLFQKANDYITKLTQQLQENIGDMKVTLTKLKDDISRKVEETLKTVKTEAKDVNVAELKDAVIAKVTSAIDAAKTKVKNVDLEKLKETVVKKVNEAVEDAKNFDARKFKDDLESTLSNAIQKATERATELKDKVSASLKQMLKKVSNRIQKRDLKGYKEMTVEERAKWNDVIKELKTVLKNKFGVQDPEEEYRLSNEARQKLAAVKKELLNKVGQTGHDDQTDDEWKQKWAKVVSELKEVLEKRRQRRELKGYKQMSDEERSKHDALLKELRQKLKDKFGVQDPEEEYRLSNEARQKLAAVKKELLNKVGQTGHDDQTDDEWKQKWAKVVSELKEVLEKRKQRRELKGFNQMSDEERSKHDALLKELRQKLKEKFGVQDPEEEYRLSNEARQKLAAVKKELLNKVGQTGHDDQTDDEWKQKWAKVVTELKEVLEKRRERRELKGYNQMSDEERAKHDALLKELRQKLKEKFGVQDPEEQYRPSPETRQKLKQVLKEIRKDQGHEDLTDDEWRKEEPGGH